MIPQQKKYALDRTNGFDYLVEGETETVTLTFTVIDKDGNDTTYTKIITITGEYDLTEDSLIATIDSVNSDHGLILGNVTLRYTAIENGQEVNRSFEANLIDISDVDGQSNLTIQFDDHFDFLRNHELLSVDILNDQDQVVSTFEIQGRDDETTFGDQETDSVVVDYGSVTELVDYTPDDSGDTVDANSRPERNDDDTKAEYKLTASGSVIVHDKDYGEDKFSPDTINNGYGELEISSDNSWDYSIYNHHAAVQALDVGETLLDTFTVVTEGGVRREIVITIHGENEYAHIESNNDWANGRFPIIEDERSDYHASFILSDSEVGEAELLDITIDDTKTSIDTDTTGNISTQLVTSIDSIEEYTFSAEQLTDINDGSAKVYDINYQSTQGDLDTIGFVMVTEITDHDELLEVVRPNYLEKTLADMATNNASVYTTDFHFFQSAALIQSLTAIKGLDIGFKYNTLDGSYRVLDIDIRGKEDPTEFIGIENGEVTEASIDSGGIITISDTFTIDDKDYGQKTLEVTEYSDTNGEFSIELIDAATNQWQWTYEISKAHFAAMTAPESETFTLVSHDGSTQDVTIDIQATDEPTVITGDVTGTVKELLNLFPDGDDHGVQLDVNPLDQDVNYKLEVSGQLSIFDGDGHDMSFQAGTYEGRLGDLTLTSEGAWTYSALNQQSAIQDLYIDESTTDTFTILSSQGATQDITITIEGEKRSWSH